MVSTAATIFWYANLVIGPICVWAWALALLERRRERRRKRWAFENGGGYLEPAPWHQMRKELPHVSGEMTPRGYGVAWLDYARHATVCYPIPVNFLARLARAAWIYAVTRNAQVDRQRHREPATTAGEAVAERTRYRLASSGSVSWAGHEFQATDIRMEPPADRPEDPQEETDRDAVLRRMILAQDVAHGTRLAPGTALAAIAIAEEQQGTTITQGTYRADTHCFHLTDTAGNTLIVSREQADDRTRINRAMAQSQDHSRANQAILEAASRTAGGIGSLAEIARAANNMATTIGMSFEEAARALSVVASQGHSAGTPRSRMHRFPPGRSEQQTVLDPERRQGWINPHTGEFVRPLPPAEGARLVEIEVTEGPGSALQATTEWIGREGDHVSIRHNADGTANAMETRRPTIRIPAGATRPEFLRFDPRGHYDSMLTPADLAGRDFAGRPMLAQDSDAEPPQAPARFGLEDSARTIDLGEPPE